jgi:hypothetical protein
MNGLLTAAGVILFLVYGVFQIYAGYVGIDFHFGGTWAGLGLVLAFIFRFTLPITLGAVFGAMDVFGWHWFLAILFAAPGLALVIPGVISAIVSAGKR